MIKYKYKYKGLTVVETILVLLCILFFIIGGLLLKYDRRLIEEKNGSFSDQLIVEKNIPVIKKDKIDKEKTNQLENEKPPE